MTQIDAISILGKGLDYMMNMSTSINIQYVNYYFNSTDYDDVTIQNITGSVWTSGIIFPVRGKQGSEEAMLIEQGKINTQDKVLYISGGILTNSSGLIIAVGSPTSENYTLIPAGGFHYNVNGIDVYKKLYIRKILDGGRLY